MNQLRELSLFTGYGGFGLGLRLAGLQTRTVAYVEWEKYPQEIIKARIKDGFLNDAPIWGDISTLDGQQFRGMVDIITAGFPCQPHSVAGLQRGADDERNLWPETLRVIREVGPRYVILENVPGLLSASSNGGTPAYGGTVVGELAQIGYGVHWQTIGANDVGAPHRRKRWWCIGVLADSDGNRANQRYFSNAERGYAGAIPEGRDSPRTQDESSYAHNGGATGGEELADSSSGRYWEPHEEIQAGGDTTEYGIGNMAYSECLKWRDYPTWPPSPGDTDGWAEILMERPDLAPAITKEAESQFRGVDDGRSHRVDFPPANERVNRIKALGNGLVPSVVAEFLRRIG